MSPAPPPAPPPSPLPLSLPRQTPSLWRRQGGQGRIHDITGRQGTLHCSYLEHCFLFERRPNTQTTQSSYRNAEVVCFLKTYHQIAQKACQNLSKQTLSQNAKFVPKHYENMYKHWCERFGPHSFWVRVLFYL